MAVYPSRKKLKKFIEFPIRLWLCGRTLEQQRGMASRPTRLLLA